MVDLDRVVDRALEDWPAVLAVITLILGHLYLMVAAGESLRPLGIPLFAAILVFLGGELLRRLW